LFIKKNVSGLRERLSGRGESRGTNGGLSPAGLFEAMREQVGIGGGVTLPASGKKDLASGLKRGRNFSEGESEHGRVGPHQKL